MNKEVIKANKEYFNYWLDGGELLFKQHDGSDWYWDESLTDWCHVGTYTKNDEYVELRKAQAEGKTIQYVFRKGCNDEHYKDIEILDCLHDVANYRIKPKEPKFKVGDWVRGNNCIFEITSIASDGEIVVNRSHTVYNSNIELWEPQQGEWVFYSHMTGYKVHRYSDDMSHYEVYPLKFVQTLKD